MCCDEQMGSYKEKGSVIWIVISEPVRIAKEFPLKKLQISGSFLNLLN